MNKMDDRFKAFLGKKRLFEDKEAGYSEELQPFKGRDLDVLLAMGESPSADQIINLVYKALHVSGNDITKDEVAELDVAYITWIAKCIGDVNGTSA
jgi:hypothetical protein